MTILFLYATIKFIYLYFFRIRSPFWCPDYDIYLCVVVFVFIVINDKVDMKKNVAKSQIYVAQEPSRFSGTA